MKIAAEKLAEEIAQLTIKTPSISVINNVAYKIEQEPSAISAALVAQLYQPVQWVQTVTQLAKYNVSLAIECGPGKVLSGLNKRIVKTIKGYSLATQDSFNQAADAVTEEN
jgi:[acyl-carrier-protein] S-malonyltransferase